MSYESVLVELPQNIEKIHTHVATPLTHSDDYADDQRAYRPGQTAQVEAHSSMVEFPFSSHRGRTASYPTAPAQIPACGITAPGSSEILASEIRQARQKLPAAQTAIRSVVSLPGSARAAL